MTEWLLGAVVIHVILRMRSMPSDIDPILNITGMSGLVIAGALIVWDWIWITFGGLNQYLLGISHLLIDVWWFVLVITGFKRLLGIPAWLGFVLSLFAFITSMPFAILFMRAPF